MSSSTLDYFGEVSGGSCGNCDNCTSSSCKEKDLSSETSLLLGCVNECGGRWGLNMPIDILRGSHAKKVVTNLFDNSVFHGQGKDHDSNWWKSLGGILVTNGFLEQTVTGRFRFISLSEQGRSFLDAYQQRPQPLLLRMTQEMCSNDDNSSDSNDESFVDGNLMSNQENLLYQMLLEVRKRIAMDNQCPPYAICSDNVLRNIANARPSNEDNLALVDGVNVNFVTRFSGVIIHSVIEMADELNLPLDNMEDLPLHNMQDFPSEGGFDDTMADNNDVPEPSDSFENYTPCIPSYDGDFTHHSIENEIFILISEHDGLTIEDIILSFPLESNYSIIQAVQALESLFLIYQKDGHYKKL